MGHEPRGCGSEQVARRDRIVGRHWHLARLGLVGQVRRSRCLTPISCLAGSGQVAVHLGDGRLHVVGAGAALVRERLGLPHGVGLVADGSDEGHATASRDAEQVRTVLVDHVRVERDRDPDAVGLVTATDLTPLLDRDHREASCWKHVVHEREVPRLEHPKAHRCTGEQHRVQREDRKLHELIMPARPAT